jgi:SAM-dependent methyltransferase
MLKSGERQVATTRDGVRKDHLARYDWAAHQLPPHSYVIDLGCGIGYGARILAEAGHTVFAVDIDAEAIEHAKAHFAHPNVEYVCAPAARVYLPEADAAVCFEVIEHLAEPLPVLQELAQAAPVLLASVPNEDVFPWRPEYVFHHRHYTPGDFGGLLAEAGFRVHWIGGQLGTESPVEPLTEGRTIAVEARRDDPLASTKAKLNRPGARPSKFEPLPAFKADEERTCEPALGHVVILGLGPSLEQYVDLTKRLGGRKAFADQVWGINSLGDILHCDVIFHMDDVRVQELRAAAKPQSNIARMVDWLKSHPGPIITSRAHPDYPGLVEFPLEDVINDLGFAYFNGTAAYAVAYAIHKGARKISLFGCDYTMPNAHHAEQGRACLEFWLGVASARGIELGFADKTSLMDTCEDPADPGEVRVYGYDFDRVKVETVEGAARITFEPRESPPTAADIEARYDHTKHPSPLVKG